MTTQQEENERILTLLAEHYKKGRSEAIEEFEKIIRMLYHRQEIGKATHFILLEEIQELKSSLSKREQ